MSDTTVVHIDESVVEGKRLGRHVEHDPRSRDFGITVAGLELKTVHHRRYGPPFDQGQVGSCTGNATAGAINTNPVHLVHRPLLHEADALAIYELATQLDSIPGSYPPDDTGSSGLAAAKAAQQKGLITSYRHAFGIDDALQALMAGPVITGVNWYEGFDNPNPNGYVEIAGQVRGGHEFEVIGYQHGPTPDESLLIAENSWGTGWGMHGRFTFTVKTWAQLLAEQGDVTVLVR